MKQTTWFWVIIAVVAIIGAHVVSRQDAYAQGDGPAFRGPATVIVEPSGALVVLDRDSNGVFRVQPNNGNRRIVSNRDRGTGPGFSEPVDIARQSNGTFVVVDRNFDAVVEVDPQTGDRTILSGCPQNREPCPVPLVGTGPAFRRLVSVAVEERGTLVVVDLDAQAVIRVTPRNGNRTVVSSANRGRGPMFDEPMGIAVLANGDLAVIDTSLDAVVEVDPDSGRRRILSGCAEVPDPCEVPIVGFGPTFLRPVDLAVRPNRTLVVVDVDRGAIVEVNPNTGERSIVSDAGASIGPVFLEPAGIAVDRNRRLFVADRVRRAIMQVNPASGARQFNSQAPSLSVSPSEGIYTASQSFDLVMIVEGDIEDVSITSMTLNVTEDLTGDLDRCDREQQLTGGRGDPVQERRCALRARSGPIPIRCAAQCEI